MNETTGIRRMKRTLLIHRIVQVLLCLLLIYMALHFQQLFAEKGLPHVFLNSLLATLLVQFLIFFPLRHFAGMEARRDVAAATTPADSEQQKHWRRQRLFSDTIKGAVFLGFTTFIMLAPPFTFILSTAFFSFIVTVITYLQCYNFAIRGEFTSPSRS